MSENNTIQEHPSLVGGHTEYIKGAAEATIGNITGSQPWKSSGEQAKAHAVDTMQTASQSRNASTQGYGHAEEVAGKFTGCEGMQSEGAASKNSE